MKELGVTTERQEDPDLLIELSVEILGIVGRHEFGPERGDTT